MSVVTEFFLMFKVFVRVYGIFYMFSSVFCITLLNTRNYVNCISVPVSVFCVSVRCNKVLRREVIN